MDQQSSTALILNQTLILQHLHNHANLITHVADRPGHDQRYAINASKLEMISAGDPGNFLNRTKKTIEWYMTNLEWCRRVQDGIYSRERLGKIRSQKGQTL